MEQKEQYELLVQKFQRDVNSLADPQKNIRLKGIKNIGDSLFSEQNDPKAVLKFFERNIIRQSFILNFSDNFEIIRSHALKIIKRFLKMTKKEQNLKEQIDKDAIQTIIKTLIERINTIDYKEKSEELRKKILKRFIDLLDQFADNFISLTNEFADMLSKILADPGPDIKILASKLTILASEKIKSSIGYHSTNVIKALTKNLLNNRFQVRLETINAIGAIMLADGAGDNFEHIRVYLKSIIQDPKVQVRQTAYQTIAKILNGMNLSNLKKYESQLVFLLLNGLSDECETIQKLTIQLLSDAGMKRYALALEFDEKIDQYLQ